jgi:hypothetical protein
MRTTSLKAIYLTEKELKQAVANWIELVYGDIELAVHLEENVCVDMSWSQGGEEFIISMDGEMTDNIMYNKASNEHTSEQRHEMRKKGYAFEEDEREFMDAALYDVLEEKDAR